MCFAEKKFSTMTKILATGLFRNYFVHAGLLLVLVATHQLGFGIAQSGVVDVDTTCEDIESHVKQLVHHGRLSESRAVALQSLHNQPECKDGIGRSYRLACEMFFFTEHPKDFLDVITTKLHDATHNVLKVQAKHDVESCNDIMIDNTDGDDPFTRWDRCCSILPQERREQGVSVGIFQDSHDAPLVDECQAENPCCEFSPDSNSFLRLPAIHEPAIRVRISKNADETKVLDLEQEGYLRPFDVSGILWPGGYLLTQCISDPIRCGISEIVESLGKPPSSSSSSSFQATSSPTTPRVLELGSGIGAASIALSKYIYEHYFVVENLAPPVLAADIAVHSLALVVSNAVSNDAKVDTVRMDHMNLTDVVDVKRRYYSEADDGFSVVMGSSLQSFFQHSEDPNSTVWTVLDVLLHKRSPPAVAVFVHAREESFHVPIGTGSDTFESIRRISGDKFRMRTFSGASSDFEVIIIRRKKTSNLHVEL